MAAKVEGAGAGNKVKEDVNNAVSERESVLPPEASLNRRVVFVEKVASGAKREGVTVSGPVNGAHVRLKEGLFGPAETVKDAGIVMIAKAPLVVGKVLKDVKGSVHLASHLDHQALVSGGEEKGVKEVRKDKVREELDEEVADLAREAARADGVARNGADELDRGRLEGRDAAKVENLAPGDGVLDAAGNVHHELSLGGRGGGRVPGRHDQRVGHKVHWDDVRLEVAVH